jgi:hypothetical protein
VWAPDDDDVRDAVMAALEESGHLVFQARDGLEAACEGWTGGSSRWSTWRCPEWTVERSSSAR